MLHSDRFHEFCFTFHKLLLSFFWSKITLRHLASLTDDRHATDVLWSGFADVLAAIRLSSDLQQQRISIGNFCSFRKFSTFVAKNNSSEMEKLPVDKVDLAGKRVFMR